MMGLLMVLLAICIAAQAEQSVWEFDYDDCRICGYQGEGGERIIPENGTADFVVVGAAIPSLPWEALANGNYQIDYYGTKMEIIWSENGFDMNCFDTMLMRFVSANE